MKEDIQRVGVTEEDARLRWKKPRPRNKPSVLSVLFVMLFSV